VQSFYSPYALPDSSQHVWIREKMEFSSTVLSTLSPYPLTVNYCAVFVCIHGGRMGGALASVWSS